MKITGVDHTSFTVSNLDQSLAFYAGLLGCEVIRQREIADTYFRQIVGFPDCAVKAAILRIPGSSHVLELFEYVTPHGKLADVRTNNPGSSHLCFLVDDLADAYEELKANGVRFRSAPVSIDAGPARGGYALYMLDPDGITVEMFQLPQ